MKYNFDNISIEMALKIILEIPEGEVGRSRRAEDREQTMLEVKEAMKQLVAAYEKKSEILQGMVDDIIKKRRKPSSMNGVLK